MEGIPGNVGGGLRMNAGAMGVETFDQVVAVTFLDEDGEIRTRKRDEIKFYYRNVPELRRNYALRGDLRRSSLQISKRYRRSLMNLAIIAIRPSRRLRVLGARSKTPQSVARVS